MKRLLLVAFALAASVSFAHTQVICNPDVEFCPEDPERPGATFDEDGTINVRTPFIPTDPYLPPNPVIVRPGR